MLSKPTDDQRIPVGTLGYFRARNRDRLHSLVLQEFMMSGLSQAVLARRLGKRPETICRWLGAPGNWTIDTASDLLFAISGAEPNYSVAYPLDVPARNDTQPDWLYLPVEPKPARLPRVQIKTDPQTTISTITQSGTNTSDFNPSDFKWATSK